MWSRDAADGIARKAIKGGRLEQISFVEVNHLKHPMFLVHTGILMPC